MASDNMPGNWQGVDCLLVHPLLEHQFKHHWKAVLEMPTIDSNTESQNPPHIFIYIYILQAAPNLRSYGTAFNIQECMYIFLHIL